MTPNTQYSNWIEVDLAAIENNVRYFLQRTQTQVMAIVKANAYGHGAIQVAEAVLRAGANWLGVARLEEALSLRAQDIQASILLLGHLPEGRYEEAIANRLALTVWRADQIQQAAQAAKNIGKTARLHLKVDTGMNRIGAQPGAAFELLMQFQGRKEVIFEGLFTHFARADEADLTPTIEQERLFVEMVRGLRASGLCPGLVHAANSAATLTRPPAYFNLVRPGIAIYGLHPSPECLAPGELRPALAWKAVLSHVKVVPPGSGISYNHEYFTRQNERIGTVPVGYADGYRRVKNNRVLVGGRKIPVVGRVCMDQMMVQLDEIAAARSGDEVVLIGAQGQQSISVEEVAQRWGTINYDVVCGINARVPRIAR
jgi:alanine racemase